MKGKIQNPNFMKGKVAIQASTGNKMLEGALKRAKETGVLNISDK